MTGWIINIIFIFYEGTEVVDVNLGAEVSFTRGRSGFWRGPKCLMLGAEVSFHEGPKCLDEGPKCLFKKRPKCPIGAEVVGAEVVGAEVVGAEVSNPPPDHHPPAVTPPDNGTCKRNCNPFVSPCYKCVRWINETQEIRVIYELSIGCVISFFRYRIFHYLTARDALVTKMYSQMYVWS